MQYYGHNFSGEDVYEIHGMAKKIPVSQKILVYVVVHVYIK
ncbi:hypothetical protein D1BOALGB6SA_1689 [Olavius sp. associated proteobacterium Delta 1]|nr:hypothetical protein D1BOALGB6SA_1689 [Olavius sp. associated proteobacterium Delta 1]